MTPRAAERHDQLTRLVDPIVGLITSVKEIRTAPGAPNLFQFQARACDTSAFAARANWKDGFGAAPTRGEALAAAIRQALGQYASALYDPEALPLVSARDADFPILSPSAWTLFSPEQYQDPGFHWRPFDDDALVRWVQATDMGSGARTHVPACKVYLPYEADLAAGETPIDQPGRAGLACAVDQPTAIAAGLCDLIARDAAMLHWQARVAPVRIRQASAPPSVKDILECFRFQDVGVHLFWLRSDSGAPVILAAVEPRAGSAQPFAAAVAAGTRVEDAAGTALCRLTLAYARAHWDREQPSAVSSWREHVRFHADRREASAFLFSNAAETDFDSIAGSQRSDAVSALEWLIDRVEGSGQRVLACDLTSPDLLEAGLSAARVLVPGYQPQRSGALFRSADSTRLRAFVEALADGDFQDNPAPHPFL